VSWYLCGAGEGEALLGDDVVGALAARGVDAVVRTASGSTVAARGTVRSVEPGRRETVVDEIGAGDAFAAGFVYGLLQGWEADDCVRAAHAIAAWALRGTGDWETLPRLDEVRDLLPGGRRGGTNFGH
jgi:2-dehydro-3-deoxygluconokinase